MGYLLVERVWDCCEELNRVFENAFIPDMNESISGTVHCQVLALEILIHFNLKFQVILQCINK